MLQQRRGISTGLASSQSSSRKATLAPSRKATQTRTVRETKVWLCAEDAEPEAGRRGPPPWTSNPDSVACMNILRPLVVRRRNSCAPYVMAVSGSAVLLRAIRHSCFWRCCAAAHHPAWLFLAVLYCCAPSGMAVSGGAVLLRMRLLTLNSSAADTTWLLRELRSYIDRTEPHMSLSGSKTRKKCTCYKKGTGNACEPGATDMPWHRHVTCCWQCRLACQSMSRRRQA